MFAISSCSRSMCKWVGVLGILGSAGILCVAGGAAPSATQPATSESAAAKPAVSIDNFKFTPATLTVAAGTTVTWVNHDDVPHTVTSKGEAPVFD